MSTPPSSVFRALADMVLPGDRQALQRLRQIAATLREQGNYFAAAYAMEHAADAAWGEPDQMQACAAEAVQDYRRIYDSHDHACALESLATLLRMIQLYWRDYLFPGDGNGSTRLAAELTGELAQRLVTCFQTSPGRDNYLVRGVIVETDFEGGFEAEFSEHEVNWGVTTASDRRVQFHLPSAFRLFTYLGDYELAQQVIDLCPNAFTTPGLRGWKSAVRGLVDPKSAAESFQEAADAFGEDRRPETNEELLRRGGAWDSMNVATWGPHFRVRSLLASAVREPGRVREFVARAAEAADPEAGGRSAPTVRRLALLVRSLSKLMSDESTIDVPEVQRSFLMLARRGETQEGDEMAVRFLELATEAFEGFRRDPAAEITTGRLAQALQAFRRLPFVEPGLSDAIEPAFGQQAMNLAQGPVRTWMHRTLERITDERQLQRIILRLSQVSLPFYAQVLHGPLEYGKDVVVYFEQHGSRVLRMYQVKAGNISLPVWQQTRSQLEEMFLVPLPEFNVPVSPELEREGVLVCNGHALPHAFPSMEGWFEPQLRDHHRNFKFMSLDGIVGWIERERLVNEFRAVLRELGLSVDVS